MDRALLIDLDDTLYDERRYVESGMAAVAAILAARCGRAAEDIRQRLLGEIDRAGRGRVFDAVLPELGLDAGCEEVAALVAAYRSHTPRLALFPGVEPVLGRLRRRYRLGVVTDGLASMQRAKVAALGLERHVDAVVYCSDEKAPKPATAAYLRALALIGAKARDAIVVGDSPAADMAAAAALGVPSIRVRGGRFAVVANLPYARPRCEIERFADIEPALERLAVQETVQ